jgi:hypothetical protein
MASTSPGYVQPVVGHTGQCGLQITDTGRVFLASPEAPVPLTAITVVLVPIPADRPKPAPATPPPGEPIAIGLLPHDLTRGSPSISRDRGSDMIWNLFDR